MKKTITVDIAVKTTVGSLFIFFAFLFLLSSGCVKKEIPKKVNLAKKSVEKVEEIEYTPQDTLWFGFDLRVGPKEDFRAYIPLLRYLENATGRRFRIKFSEKFEDAVQDLGNGVTHFAAVGTLNYIIGEGEYGIKYLASGVNKEGDTTHYSAIFTAPKSSVKRLEDLQGKCFAFGSKTSAQGHLIPRKMLEDAGITLNSLSRFVHTGSYLDTVKSVLNGDCDAGGIQDVLAKDLESEGKIRILAISAPYPGSLIAYNSSLDSRTVESVRAALLGFEPAGKHKAIMTDWDKTEMPMGFTKVDEPEMEKVRALAREYGLLTR